MQEKCHCGPWEQRAETVLKAPCEGPKAAVAPWLLWFWSTLGAQKSMPLKWEVLCAYSVRQQILGSLRDVILTTIMKEGRPQARAPTTAHKSSFERTEKANWAQQAPARRQGYCEQQRKRRDYRALLLGPHPRASRQGRGQKQGR